MEKRRPLILITNDDGIRSPGLRAAATALEEVGDVLITAPALQQSGTGRSMPPASEGRIIPHKIALNGHEAVGYGVEGSPAQVVQHAILEIAPRLPDLVVSGINYGENIGSGITVSGTVGAAMEGADFGLPAIAISRQTAPQYYLDHSDVIDFAVASYFLQVFARHVLAEGLPAGVDLLNINLPQSATLQTPWRYTRVSRQRYFYAIKPHRRRPTDPGPMGFEIRIDPEILEEDSDIRAVAIDGVVSVTPVTLDLTARVDGAILQGWLK